jgi:hypothetical protein
MRRCTMYDPNDVIHLPTNIIRVPVWVLYDPARDPEFPVYLMIYDGKIMILHETQVRRDGKGLYCEVYLFGDVR